MASKKPSTRSKMSRPERRKARKKEMERRFEQWKYEKAKEIANDLKGKKNVKEKDILAAIEKKHGKQDSK